MTIQEAVKTAKITAPPLLSPIWAELIDRKAETVDTSTFTLAFQDAKLAKAFRFQPGQFNMLYLPSYGEAAISISSSIAEPNPLAHTIRTMGNVTRAINRMAIGDLISIRGPFGRPWPIADHKGKDIVLAAGGIGLAPLRPVVYHILANRKDYGRVVLIYGARTPDDLLFTDELDFWEEGGIELMVTVDRASEGWKGQVGVVPMLFYRLWRDLDNAVVYTCGPEIMMRFVVYEGLARNIPKDRIFVSLERNMKCAQALCGHCQLGPFFICKDGPVYSFEQLEPYFNVEQF